MLKHYKKILVLLVIAGGVVLAGVVDAQQCQYHNVYGYAWSENIGWLSTNCENSGSEHWMLVNDRVIDELGSYVYTDSDSYQEDVYELEDPSPEAGEIGLVTVIVMFRGCVQASIRIGGQEIQGNSFNPECPFPPLIESFFNVRFITFFAPFQDPWTIDEITNMQLIVRLKRSSVQGKVTQVYVDTSSETLPERLRPNADAQIGIEGPPVGSAPPNYGVDINETTGQFSGYAWSENIGWISFNSAELTGCPSGTCEARLNLSTREVSGWARALANGDGWDGWIKLRGTWPNGVSLNTAVSPVEFEGWAWGSDVVGWVSFNCSNTGVCATSNYKVMTDIDINASPDTPTNLDKSWGYCGGMPAVNTRTTLTLSWSPFSDDDPEDDQQAYEVEIDGNSYVASVAGSSYSVNPANHGVLSFGWGTSHNWRVRVQDNNSNWSGWSGLNSFTMPINQAPNPSFSKTPAQPRVGQTVNFTTDPDDIFDGLVGSFSWTFQDATPATSSDQNPSVTFNSSGAKQVTLTATDSVGSCTAIETVAVSLSLPTWKEIAPF